MTLLEIVVDMSQEKGTYHIGQAYVVFSHVTQLSKLLQITTVNRYIHVSGNMKADMTKFDVDSVQGMPTLFVLTCDKWSNLCIAQMFKRYVQNKLILYMMNCCIDSSVCGLADIH